MARELCFFRCTRFLVWILLVSLVFVSTNSLVKSSIEASSPEEKRHENDLPLSGLIPPGSSGPTNSLLQSTVRIDQTNSLVDFQKILPIQQGASPLSPLLTEGVFPYQASPIGAVIAASLTMTLMVLKETGRVDFEGLGYLLNSTDFYSGIVGSLTASFTHRQTSKAIELALKRGVVAYPKVFKPIMSSGAALQVANIVKGFTYTLAISSGFEYFSQVWKHVTLHIPECQSVSGFLRADPLRRKQVYSNLLYYLVMDTAMQKRILSSVYNHRILTFEFIAMNVALYVGSQVGAILTKKYGAKTPWLVKVGPAIGSITGGVLVQMLPSSWKSAANLGLVNYKLSAHQHRLDRDLKAVEENVAKRYYPTEDRARSGYFMLGVDLQSDIERVLRERDMVASLQVEQISTQPGADAFQSLLGTFDGVQGRLSALLDSVRDVRMKSMTQEIQKMIESNRTPEEIERSIQSEPARLPSARYYEILLDAAVARCRDATLGAQGLIQSLSENRKLSASQMAVFGLE